MTQVRDKEIAPIVPSVARQPVPSVDTEMINMLKIPQRSLSYQAKECESIHGIACERNAVPGKICCQFQLSILAVSSSSMLSVL